MAREKKKTRKATHRIHNKWPLRKCAIKDGASRRPQKKKKKLIERATMSRNFFAHHPIRVCTILFLSDYRKYTYVPSNLRKGNLHVQRRARRVKGGLIFVTYSSKWSQFYTTPNLRRYTYVRWRIISLFHPPKWKIFLVHTSRLLQKVKFKSHENYRYKTTEPRERGGVTNFGIYV